MRALVESGSTARAIQVLAELWSDLSDLSKFRMHYQAAKELVAAKKVCHDGIRLG